MKITNLFLVLSLLVAPSILFAQEGDPALLERMRQINDQLQSMGLNVAVEEIHFFTIGAGRPSARIHQTGLRWVAGDERRIAQGNDITYIVDQSGGTTTSGLTNAQTEAAIDRALNTWDASKPLKKVDLVKRADPGTDITIYDFFLIGGGFGDPFAGDIVNAGWFPLALFNAAAGGGPTSGCNILAFSVSFIFINPDGSPTDINGDNYLDTALNEVYYNDEFGNPASPCSGFDNPWGINVALPGVDVETVALHENGHSLGIGHFGPPPAAVLNPVYAGIRQSPFPIDLAGMSAVWGSWPK